MVSIARKNLLEDIPRFLVAQAGIMFAVSLIIIQTGIFNGFTRSAGQVIDNSSADIWVASESMVFMDLTLPIPQAYAVLAQQVPGVDLAEALIFKTSVWRERSGNISAIKIVGFNPEGELFLPVNVIQESVSVLKKPYSVMVDKTNLDSLKVRDKGDVAEVALLPAKVVGFTHRNRSIASSPYMFTSLESANAYSSTVQAASLNCQLPVGGKSLKCTNTYVKPEGASNSTPKQLVATDPITFVLIRATQGEDLEALKQKLEAALSNTRAYTSTEIIEKNQTYWQKRTGIGFILGLGGVVGVLVGAIVVSQILYSSVSDRIKEFGTLKAMGASDWVIYGTIVEQALWMAILGYIPGLAIGLGVGAWTYASQGISILITPTTAIAVLGITLVMCVGSAIFAIQKVTRLDPAIVFKA